jgi:hypothetical protein
MAEETYRSVLEYKINQMPRKAHSGSMTMHDYNGGVIGSSRGYFSINGKLMAVPHKTSSRSASTGSLLLSQPKIQAHSEYSKQFYDRPFCYSSMDNKPLVPYDPLHPRSRNMQEDLVMPYKNASVVTFDAGLVGRTKKPYQTTQKTYHDGQEPSFITNAAIVAEQLKQKKATQSK